MCGIVGIVDFLGRHEIDRALLHRMNESQFHRGPDEGGIHIGPGVGLGHRRLSIIDLSGGQQPLYNEDRTVVVVFNGEIYNFKELVSELESLGHVFRTRSDTEVIVHGWESWGAQCVQRFRGMFAFAIWDMRRRTLFLARDRLGVKPLFYSVLGDGSFAFGSELKSLLVLPGLDRSIDPLAVEEYFAYGYVPEPRTIFKSVAKLPPGTTLLVEPGQPAPEPVVYWDIAFRDSGVRSEQDVVDELLVRMREAVRIRMISEVPLGAFLSGGVDSSAVVAMMAEVSAKPVNTCSISFGHTDYDESKYAQLVANQFRTDHHVDAVDPDDLALVDKLAGIYDEPYADSSAIPTYRVCELARKNVTVALSGDGGDENFGGYRRYRLHLNEERVRALVPLNVRRPLFGLLGNVYPKADWAPRVFRAKTTFQALARSSVDAYFHTVSLMDDNMRRALFTSGFRRELGGYSAVDVMRRHAANAATDDPLSLIQYLDLKTYLVGDILTKVDRASMAHALEVREPLLDHPMLEWLATLPSSLKVRGGEGKYILKKGLEPLLPHAILYRPKMGFAVPLASWFRGPLRQHVRNVLLGPVLADTGIFNVAFIRHLVEQHQSGMRDFSAGIWSLLMFESFLRNVMGGSRHHELLAAG